MRTIQTFPGSHEMLVDGKPIQELAVDELRDLVRELVVQMDEAERALGVAGNRVSAGYEYRSWRAKPPEGRKPGVAYFDKDGIG